MSLISLDVLERAVKTFVQAFLAVVLIADNPIRKDVLIAGVAAGISAVWNFVKSTV